MRRLIFLRDFQALSGGHLKVWHFYRHACDSGVYSPAVHFTEGSRLDDSNPFIAGGAEIAPDWNPSPQDAIFLGGDDWKWLDADRARAPDPRTPIINIVQGMRHADPADPRYAYLGRRALRLCVNPLIEAALRAVPVAGLVRSLPLGIDVGNSRGASESGGSRDGIVVAALKQPALGRWLAARLERAGHRVRLLDAMLPRDEYLRLIADAHIAVLLPMTLEGFYLPALEAMAMGTLVVCPDCIGNRVYLDDGVNGAMPAPAPEAILASTLALALQDDASLDRMRERARATASRHSLEEERRAFLEFVDAADLHWQDAA